MASNNPSKSNINSTKKYSCPNQSQEISSLEDSESTLSHHGTRKIVTLSNTNEEQKLDSSSYPNTVNNINLNTNSHRQYPNVAPHGTILNDTRVVTFQNPMYSNPNAMQPMHFQPNFCHPPYFHPSQGIAMNHYPSVNQHHLSQHIHPPFAPYPAFPAYHHGSSMNSIPYPVNASPFPPSLHHNPPQHSPIPEPPKKKRKKKPNDKRIQKFRNKAARHQKALALGMALLDRMEESNSKEITPKEITTSTDCNHSTTFMESLKNNQKSRVSNISFDINENVIGSISNTNISANKVDANEDKTIKDISVITNISVAEPISTKSPTDVSSQRPITSSSQSTASSKTSASVGNHKHDGQSLNKKTHSSNRQLNTRQTDTIISKTKSSSHKNTVDTPDLTKNYSSNKSSLGSHISSKNPISSNTKGSQSWIGRSSFSHRNVSRSHASSSKQRRPEGNSRKLRTTSTEHVKNTLDNEEKRSSCISRVSSLSKKHNDADAQSTSSISKRSSRSLPSYNSSLDRKGLFSNTIPKKSRVASTESQSRSHPTHVFVQNNNLERKKNSSGWRKNNDSSGWSKKKNSSSGWGTSSPSSSLVDLRRKDKNCNPLAPKKTTSYGGWLPTYYKGPPITNKVTDSKMKKKDKRTKERNRRQRLELVKMLKKRLSQPIPKPKESDCTFKRLESRWKIQFLEQFPREMLNLRLLWTTSFTNHFVGLKIFSMLGEAQLEIIGHISCFIIGNNALSLDSSSTDDNAETKKAFTMELLRNYKNNLLDMEYSDYRFLCGVIRCNKKERADKTRSGFLLTSNQVADFCFGEKGECIRKFMYGSEMALFYRKKRALLRTIYELDKISECNKEKNSQETTDLQPLTYNSDGDISIKSYMFEGHDEDAFLTQTRHDSSCRDTLLSLMFTGFEHSMKCPFSKIYSDVNYLYPCDFPDELCKNGRYYTLETLLQHVDSKHCTFHDILGKYIRYFNEDNNEDCVRILMKRKRDDCIRELNKKQTCSKK